MDDQQALFQRDEGERPSTVRGRLRAWWGTMPSPIRWRKVTAGVGVLAIGVALIIVGAVRVAAAETFAQVDRGDLIAAIAGVLIVLATPPMVLRSITIDLRETEAVLNEDWTRSQTLRSLLGFDDPKGDEDDATDRE